MFGPKPRKEMPPRKLDRAAFEARFRAQFPGDAFAGLQAELDRVAEAAWTEYDSGKKGPRTAKAGPGYADPDYDYDLAVDWIRAKAAIDRAAERHRDPQGPSRILLVNASPRTEHTCLGET